MIIYAGGSGKKKTRNVTNTIKKERKIIYMEKSAINYNIQNIKLCAVMINE